jgi:nucleoside-diphosphate-sugar epimerase
MQSQESRDADDRVAALPETAPAGAYVGRKVLITGGLGFLGSNLAIRLVRGGAQVTLLDSLIPQGGGSRQNIASILDDVAVKTCDMRDTASLEMLVQGKEYIFNLAAHVSHADSMREPQLDLACNCAATLNLVEACRKFAPEAKLVYTSTRQVYGRPQRLPVNEDHPALPIDINGIHKLAAEYYHLLYDGAYGIRSTVLRLTNTYGPRQRINDDRQGVAAVFLRQALLGKTIDLYAGGHQRRDFNYVEDVVDALLLAANNPRCHSRVFNLGAARPHSLLDFTAVLRELCEFAIRCVPFPSDQKIIDIGDYYGDYSAFREVTGWEPRTSLEEGLRHTIAFYREQGNGYL